MFSFPTVLFGWHAPNLGILGWVALVPLFVAIANASPRRTFVLAFMMGLAWFGGSLYWIFNALHVYGKLSISLSIVVTILLIVILAAYMALAPFLARFVTLRWKAEMIVFMPVAWVALELARTNFPMGGFPWANLAMSQWALLVPLQIVDLVGVYGLMFAMVWVNWYIAELILKFRGSEVRWLLPKLVVTSMIIVGMLGYGVYRLQTLNRSLEVGGMVNTAILQGNIRQSEKWDEQLATRNLNVHRKMTKRVFEAGADLIVWPEASFPFLVASDVKSANPRVMGLPKDLLGDLPAVLFGAVVDEAGNTGYNSALMFNAKGILLGRYDKVHLVPFGEYIPYKKVLFFVKKLTQPEGEFLPGAEMKVLEFPKGKIGLLLCFEDAFPELSRKFVLKGVDLLVNITNDAWYDISSAPYQHAALSVFRAVENRRYLIRSANTGVSALIAPSGEILMQSPIFERSILAGAVWPVKNITPYARYGDWFAYACVAYSVIGAIMALIMGIRMRRRLKRSANE
jgi:apolipoprotein N-acyltransferase